MLYLAPLYYIYIYTYRYCMFIHIIYVFIYIYTDNLLPKPSVWPLFSTVDRPPPLLSAASAAHSSVKLFGQIFSAWARRPWMLPWRRRTDQPLGSSETNGETNGETLWKVLFCWGNFSYFQRIFLLLWSKTQLFGPRLGRLGAANLWADMTLVCENTHHLRVMLVCENVRLSKLVRGYQWGSSWQKEKTYASICKQKKLCGG